MVELWVALRSQALSDLDDDSGKLQAVIVEVRGDVLFQLFQLPLLFLWLGKQEVVSYI